MTARTPTYTSRSVPGPGAKKTASSPYPFRITFLFTVCYFLICHGRILFFAPFLRILPFGMISGVLVVTSYMMESKQIKERPVIGREGKIVLGLLAICIATLPTSIWIGGSINGLYKTYIPMVILMFITANISLSVDNIKDFLWVLSVNCILICYMVLTKDVSHITKNITDTYDTNDIAMVLVCSLPVLYQFMQRNKGIRKKFLLVCLLVMLAAILRTASRGGLLGLIVLGGYQAVSYSGSKLKYFMLLCVAAVSFFMFAPQETVDRFSSMYKPKTEYDENLGDRTQVWKAGVRLFFDSPLLGYGYGNAPVAHGQQEGSKSWLNVHNSFLQAAVELGVVGLLLHIALSVGTFLKFRGLRKRFQDSDDPGDVLWLVRGLELSLLAYPITAFFLSQAYNAQFYFLISLAIAAQKFLPVLEPPMQKEQCL